MGFSAMALESPSRGAKDDRCKPGERIEVSLDFLPGTAGSLQSPKEIKSGLLKLFTLQYRYFYIFMSFNFGGKNKLLLRGTVI